MEEKLKDSYIICTNTEKCPIYQSLKGLMKTPSINVIYKNKENGVHSCRAINYVDLDSLNKYLSKKLRRDREVKCEKVEILNMLEKILRRQSNP